MDPRTGQILAMASAPGFDPNDYTRSDRSDLGQPAGAGGVRAGQHQQGRHRRGGDGEGRRHARRRAFTVPDHIKTYDRVFHDSQPAPDRSGSRSPACSPSPATSAPSWPARRVTDGAALPVPARLRVRREDRAGAARRDARPAQAAVPVVGHRPLPDRVRPDGVGERAADGQRVRDDRQRRGPRRRRRSSPAPSARTTPSPRRRAPARTPGHQRAARPRQISDMLEGAPPRRAPRPRPQITGYRVAGKTGTAQIVNPRCGCYNGGGYTALVRRASRPPTIRSSSSRSSCRTRQRGSHYGGDVAAPVFKDVMSFALQSRKIPPTGSRPPKIRIYADETDLGEYPPRRESTARAPDARSARTERNAMRPTTNPARPLNGLAALLGIEQSRLGAVIGRRASRTTRGRSRRGDLYAALPGSRSTAPGSPRRPPRPAPPRSSPTPTGTTGPRATGLPVLVVRRRARPARRGGGLGVRGARRATSPSSASPGPAARPPPCSCWRRGCGPPGIETGLVGGVEIRVGGRPRCRAR